MTHKVVLLFHKKYEHSDGEIIEVKAPSEFISIERLVERFTAEVGHFRRRMT